MSLQEIVNVVIDRQTAGISRAGFGTPMLLSSEAASVSGFTQRARVYTSVEAIINDGFAATGVTVQAAQRVFGQNPAVRRLVIGRRENLPQRTVKLTPVALDSTEYVVTVDGNAASFTSGVGAVVADITAGLKADIDGLAIPNISTTDNGTDLDISMTAPGTVFTLRVDNRELLLQADVTTEPGAVADLTAIRTSITGNDEWYALISDLHAADEIAALAASIEGTEKIFLAACGDDDILAGTPGSIGEVLSAANYDRTALFYHETPDEFPEAAWAGRVLNIDPGEETWAYKTLAGIPASLITTTEETNLAAANVNRYVEQTEDRSITKFGTMASGEYIDIIRFVDFVTARIRENIFRRLTALNKIPFTDGGIAIIENEIRGVLNTGVSDGGFAEEPAPAVTVPRAADVSAADKANRLLPDVRFTATLAGAVHLVEVRGVVSL